MRDNILRTQSNSNNAAISGFDNLVAQLKVFATQINEKNTEISRLVQLCAKNKIDTSITPVIPKVETKPTPVIQPKKQ